MFAVCHAVAMLVTMTATCYHDWYKRFLTLRTMLMLMSTSIILLPSLLVLLFVPFVLCCPLMLLHSLA